MKIRPIVIKQVDPERKKREEELSIIRGRVNEIADKLGLGIDSGIKEGVVIFNAFGLRTSQSCEGHFGQEGEEGVGSPTPWIDVSPQEPSVSHTRSDLVTDRPFPPGQPEFAYLV